MKLYDSVGPNPHVVRMFLAEKGVSIPIEKVDLRGLLTSREPLYSMADHVVDTSQVPVARIVEAIDIALK